MRLRIQLVCPAPRGSLTGNRVSAERWARILRDLGHAARVTTELVGSPDVLVALHARRSAAAARAFKERHPARPLVVALTGTDLYGDLPRGDPRAAHSVELADRLVVLQAAGRRSLAPGWRRKAVVVHQSVTPPANVRRAPDRPGSPFDAVLLAHLRPVKDPLRPALAVRNLPESSRLRVVHLGAALDAGLAARARAEQRRNPRYRWLGERPRAGSLRLLARARLLVVPSRMEGGANVIGEAAVLGVPVVASRVDGNTGLLGARYPGLFPAGDTAALRALLLRVESDARFLARLTERTARLAPLFGPDREREAWRALVGGLGALPGR